MSNKQPKEEAQEWKLIGHSHQIADTGDYSGSWEITNGKISILTQSDDEEEVFQPIIDALNNSGKKFYIDDGEMAYLSSELTRLQRENERLEKEVEQQKANEYYLRCSWDTTTQERDDLKADVKVLTAIKKGIETSLTEAFAELTRLKEELKNEKEQHQISMDAMANAIDTNEDLSARIQQLEAGIREAIPEIQDRRDLLVRFDEIFDEETEEVKAKRDKQIKRLTAVINRLSSLLSTSEKSDNTQLTEQKTQ